MRKHRPVGKHRSAGLSGRSWAAAMLAALVGGLAAPGAGADPPAPVGLDSLLRLPSETDPVRQPEAGGVTRERWEARFDRARADVREAERALEAAQAELEDLASDSEAWQMAAPGANPTAENSPLSYKLRQEIRRQREAVERAERRLRELETEASLAGVPEAWRKPTRHEDATPGAPGTPGG